MSSRGSIRQIFRNISDSLPKILKLIPEASLYKDDITKWVNNLKGITDKLVKAPKHESRQQIVMEFANGMYSDFKDFIIKRIFPIIVNRIAAFARNYLKEFKEIKNQKELSTQELSAFRNEYVKFYYLLNPLERELINLSDVVEKILMILNVQKIRKTEILNELKTINNVYKTGRKINKNLRKLKVYILEAMGTPENEPKHPTQEIMKFKEEAVLLKVPKPDFSVLKIKQESEENTELLKKIEQLRKEREEKIQKLTETQAATEKLRIELENTEKSLMDAQNGVTIEDLLQAKREEKKELVEKMKEFRNTTFMNEKNHCVKTQEGATEVVQNYADIVSQILYVIKNRNKQGNHGGLPSIEEQNNLIAKAVESKKRPTLESIPMIVDAVKSLSKNE
ncbi:hypothetical protein TRFO_36526 [Tritrichomonas foetus]|uniref:Uncharacterized protein n=1 Tax=Tritrichomonas foetus TaxID=1144522 RepID=A0A1J4JJB3_9EUKA|nr:hypothetical protein TRFO_36526 [Tritrichomonas foetus]|eukprot:OHS97324.1 hypothetical protein TRFO_36526 [Tritrichomonas foetus]